MNNALLPKPKYLWVPIGMAWSMVTMRPEAFCLSVLLLITLSLPPFRRKTGLLGIIGGLLALLPFSPIGITATDAPGPPKLIECCPGMPLRYRQTKAAAQRGECVFCSDMITGFAAKYYLVW